MELVEEDMLNDVVERFEYLDNGSKKPLSRKF